MLSRGHQNRRRQLERRRRSGFGPAEAAMSGHRLRRSSPENAHVRGMGDVRISIWRRYPISRNQTRIAPGLSKTKRNRAQRQLSSRRLSLENWINLVHLGCRRLAHSASTSIFAPRRNRIIRLRTGNCLRATPRTVSCVSPECLLRTLEGYALLN